MKIRVALAQINPTVGDIEGNYRKIVSFIEKAKKLKSDFIIFPELALVGYPPEDLLLNPDFLSVSFQFTKKIVDVSEDIVVLLGAPFLENNHLFNACFIMQNKKIKYIYKKMFLPNYSVFDEKRYFLPGNEMPLIFNSQLKFTVTICEDIWEETSPIFYDFSHKVNIVFNLSASPFFVGKIKRRKKILKNLALKTGAYVVYCNLVGGQDELVFDGRSLVFSPQGEELICAKSFEEDFVIVDLDVRRGNESEDNMKRIRIDDFTLKRRGSIFIKKRKDFKESGLEEIYKVLVLGTHDYVVKNGFKKAVIGLSGGIDSSLTCVIARDALGKDNVMGVIMPSHLSSHESVEDAQKLAKNLGIKFFIVPIEEIFKVYREIFKKHFKKVADITLQNIQARIRGNILMAFSNNFGWIVLTTGNKSEAAVGYCTLYGDTAGGFAVIKDIPKTLVYKLARFRNQQAGFDLIPERVLKKPPTAELRPNQRDEDDLCPYKILDKIIDLYVEKNWDLKRIIKEGIPQDLVFKIVLRIDRNEYKRRLSPIGIKISLPVSGKDRKMPITNRFIIKK
ncbi:MAG: hypothetical protein B6D56_07560 [Candidatus Omnitrophica bacterium 4484_70.1]|nr:MAG: hypothetical protein B6D56_07560 [Candidatus Omnitrophica bacterium 4484_70.1]